jgi:hypothetical protein
LLGWVRGKMPKHEQWKAGAWIWAKAQALVIGRLVRAVRLHDMNPLAPFGELWLVVEKGGPQRLLP